MAVPSFVSLCDRFALFPSAGIASFVVIRPNRKLANTLA
jgi:hypothetical protein